MSAAAHNKDSNQIFVLLLFFFVFFLFFCLFVLGFFFRVSLQMLQPYELWVISLGKVAKCLPESTYLSDFTVGQHCD